MKSKPTWILLIMTAALAVGLFHIKYKVIDIERDISTIDRQMVEEREAIHVLKGEWSQLNELNRLSRMNQKYLKYQPEETTQHVPDNMAIKYLSMRMKIRR